MSDEMKDFKETVVLTFDDCSHYAEADWGECEWEAFQKHCLKDFAENALYEDLEYLVQRFEEEHLNGSGRYMGEL